MWWRRDRNLRAHLTIPTCSYACMAVLGSASMIDPTEAEIAAMQAASAPAGEYIESLGKTDMAKFSEAEWMQFIEVIVTAYTDAMIAGQAPMSAAAA